MKLEWNKRMSRKVLIYSFSGIIILLAYFILKNPAKVASVWALVRETLRPFTMAFVFAYLLNTPMMFLEKYLFKIEKLRPHEKIIRSIAILLTWIMALALLAMFFYIVIPDIKDSILALANNLPGYYEEIKTVALKLIQRYDIDRELFSNFLDFNVTPSGVLKIVETYGKELIPQIANIANLGVQIGNFVIDLVISIIVSIYFLFSKETLLAQARKLQYALFQEKTAANIIRIADITDTSFSGFINGKLIDSFIIGILCFIGMSILGFEYPMLISFIVGVTNIIPVFGPFFGAVPSVLLLLIINPWHALWFAVFVLALQQLDGNVIGPKILGESTGLPALWVMFAIVVGGGLLGVLGMFIGVPAFAVIYKLIKENLTKKLDKKKLPSKTEDYMREPEYKKEVIKECIQEEKKKQEVKQEKAEVEADPQQTKPEEEQKENFD